MKWTMVFLCLLFLKNSGVGQEEAHRDFFKIKGLDTMWVTFTRDDGDWLYWERDGTEKKLRKQQAEAWYKYDPANEPWPMVDGEVAWQRVVPVEGMKAEDIHAGARLWFADAFNSGKDVVQVDDPANRVLVGKGWMPLLTKVWMGYVSAKLWFSLRVEAKDGRLRATAFDFSIQDDPSKYDLNPKPWALHTTPTYKPEKDVHKELKRQVFEKMEGLMGGIGEGIRKNAPGGEESKW